MLLKEFYTSVLTSEAVCVDFLQNNVLIGEAVYHNPCHSTSTYAAVSHERLSDDAFIAGWFILPAHRFERTNELAFDSMSNHGALVHVCD